MNGKVIELGLGIPQNGQTQVAAFRNIIDRSLLLLRDWLAAFGDPDRQRPVRGTGRLPGRAGFRD